MLLYTHVSRRAWLTGSVVGADDATPPPLLPAAPPPRLLYGISCVQAAVSEASNVLNAPARGVGADNGVLMSAAAAARRRSLMGTGLNIGGAFGMGVNNSDDSDSSDGFEDSGSFNVSSRQEFEGDGLVECQ